MELKRKQLNMNSCLSLNEIDTQKHIYKLTLISSDRDDIEFGENLSYLVSNSHKILYLNHIHSELEFTQLSFYIRNLLQNILNDIEFPK